ncbi:rhodanese-like domain-containing protein [Novosphingobium umbonatum]|nr:rhodanese-like domain-containing protein [Novosphingobium umbonatum]
MRCFARFWGIALACCALPSLALAQSPAPAPLFDADGYRSGQYRAPVDRTPEPARKLPLAKALRMVAGHNALFIDVAMPENGLRDAKGEWQLALPHSSIKGAVWLPAAGKAPPDSEAWARLQAIVAARPQAPVVLFCHQDCWMGWNAARRLAREGRTHVFWLEEGVEGWSAAGGPTAMLHPR